MSMRLEAGGTLNVGLIGCGAAGMHHLEAMLGTKGIAVSAVCDINKACAGRAGRIAEANVYLDAGMMMRAEDLDAVSIITSAHTHYTLARLAAKHGLHVICEKPLTARESQGKTLVRLFGRAGLVLAVTFTYRYVEETRLMRRLIQTGTIGRLLELRHTGWGGLPRKYRKGTAERKKYDVVYGPEIRGIIFDCGVHTFDLFRWLSGEEYVTFVGMGACHQGYPFPDSATVTCEMTGGVKCLLDHGPLPYHMNGASGIPVGIIAAAGTKGSIVWKIAYQREGDWYLSELAINTKERSRTKTFPLFSKCRDLQYRDFVRSVKAGKLVGAFPDPEDANGATAAANRALDAVMKNLTASSSTASSRAS